MKEFMTPTEYAEFAGVTLKTITELKQSGFLPVLQVSKHKYLINVGKMMRDQEKERLAQFNQMQHIEPV